MARRITILGMGPSATDRRHDILRYCDGTEIWSLNNAYVTFPKVAAAKKFDRFFELHSWQYLSTWEAGRTDAGRPVNHMASLDALGCPVYSGQRLPLIQNQILVDWVAFGKYWQAKLFCDVAAELDAGPSNLAAYFMGSPSTMLALALYEHDNGQEIEYIQSWGIDTTDRQHQCQRAAWSFWISQALSRGIKIGGTAAAYMFDFEIDEGLNGLRELITQQVADATAKRQEP
jgi:hypothetical protein